MGKGKSRKGAGLWVNLMKMRKLCDSDEESKALSRWLCSSRIVGQSLPLEHILDTEGPDDALLAVQAVSGHNGAMRLYACFCARKALLFFEQRYPAETRLRSALDTAERHARGQATDADLAAARAVVKAVYADVHRDPAITSFIMEELYASMNPAAVCLDAAPYTCNRDKAGRASWVAYVFDDAVEAFGYFIGNVVSREDAAANRTLEDEDPLESFFTGHYTIPALSAAGAAVDDAAKGAVDALAEGAIGLLAAGGICALDPGAAKEAMKRVVWNIVCRSAMYAVKAASQDALRRDLLAEFGRLCRLEDTYAEAMEK
jgi:hypothetical protein